MAKPERPTYLLDAAAAAPGRKDRQGGDSGAGRQKHTIPGAGLGGSCIGAGCFLCQSSSLADAGRSERLQGRGGTIPGLRSGASQHSWGRRRGSRRRQGEGADRGLRPRHGRHLQRGVPDSAHVSSVGEPLLLCLVVDSAHGHQIGNPSCRRRCER